MCQWDKFWFLSLLSFNPRSCIIFHCVHYDFKVIEQQRFSELQVVRYYFSEILILNSAQITRDENRSYKQKKNKIKNTELRFPIEYDIYTSHSGFSLHLLELNEEHETGNDK